MDDPELFDVLDRYLEAIRSGNAGLQAELLEKFPQAVELLGCLDSLEQLAPQPRPGLKTSRNQLGDTVRYGDALLAPDGLDGFQIEAGQTFGKYELLAEIGRGGMGVVYKARQKDLDRVVALKMILSSRLASGEEVRRFYREAKAAGSLRHPNIVGIHEVGQVHSQHYFAMDYVVGRSLAAMIQNSPLETDTAVKYLLPIVRAVDYLHQHQIVHRDLKPSNILIDDEGHPYLTDFGLAKVFEIDDQHTKTGVVMGTPSYMSPEQAAGHSSQISHRTDVYSLGAVLYEMLTGRPPFQEENQLNTLLQVLEGEPTLPHRLNPRIPPELERICMRCLEKDPAERYPTAAALADDMERFLRHEPLEARPVGLRQSLRRWARREPALLGRLSAIGLAAGIVQVRYLFVGHDLVFHVKVMAVFGAWALVSFILQRLANRDTSAAAARYAWAAADVILITTALELAEKPLGALLIGYPVIVVASGLWFRVRLVAVTTVLSLATCTALVVQRSEDDIGPIYYRVLYLAVLAVIGFIVAYQVHRVRTLSRYFEQQRLP